MDKSSLILAGVAGIVIALTVHWFSSSPSTSLAVVGGNFHQFGRQKVNQVLRHTFRIENPTPHPVKIERLMTSCACLMVGKEDDLVGKIVEPGQSIDVSVALSTENRVKRVSGTVGLLVKHLGGEIKSPHSDREETIRLNIEAYVPPDVTVAPESIDYGSLIVERMDASLVHQVDVTVREGVVWELGQVSDEILQVAKNPDASSFSVRIDPAIARVKEPGICKCFVELLIIGSGQDKLFVPVQIDLASVLTIKPPFLTFQNSSEEKKVTLVSGESFQIKSIQVNQESLPVADENPSKQHELRLSLHGAQPEKGEVVFTVGLQNGEEVVKSVDYFILENNHE